jgi:WD40 repeat protein
MMPLLALALFLIAAACQPNAPVPARPTQPVRSPTLPPPLAWIEAGEPIRRGNADQTRLLGRLDPPSIPSTAFASAVAPDGTRLAVLNNTQVLAWDLITGALIFQTARVDYTRIFYSPDKTELYALNNDGLVDILNAETGGVIGGFAGYEPYAGVYAFDEENGFFAFGGMDGAVRVWDALERRARVTINAHDARVTALAFSRDGARLASADSGGRARLWDWAARTPLAEIQNEGVIVGALAFAPAGSPIAIGTMTDARLWLPDADRLIRLFSVENPTIDLLAFAPAGDYLLGGSGRGVFLWATTPAVNAPPDAPPAEPLRLPGVIGSTVSAGFSPDGALLATAALDTAPALWDMTNISAQTVARGDLPLPQDAPFRIFAVRWTPDGRLLLLFDAAGAIYTWGIPTAPS